ncbi:MAG: thiamine phosphate synthase [Nitrospirae bacterium]|nr:thiamine phosphate synthase [Magnetococcales bacterium]HAT50627.1 thiamine phosphate synthase [Alphaproteobacteria bacterium]
MTRLSPFPSGIYPILDATWLQQNLNEESWPDNERIRLVRDMENAGIQSVQLRCKHSADRCRPFFTRWLRVIRDEMELARVIINDHLRLAIELNADGVHVGQDDTAVTECRALLGSHRMIGLSTHNLVEIEDSLATSVDYVGFGPLFATQSKADTKPVCGLDSLAEAVRKSQKPLVAIGGIGPENLYDIAMCGARAAAMISGLWGPGGRFLGGHCVREFTRGIQGDL